jgi:hypothetical protein
MTYSVARSPENFLTKSLRRSQLSLEELFYSSSLFIILETALKFNREEKCFVEKALCKIKLNIEEL